MNDPLGVLRQLYPNARVTSTYRDPNSALGRANPRSYHNIGQAFDVAPMQGVSFGDYVNNLKSHGVNVVEALDEASNPKPWTTGPNWHIAYGGASVAPQRKPRTLGDMTTPQSLQDYQQALPMSLDAQPMQPGAATLGDLTQQTPQLPQPSHKTAHTLGDIAGILGDALMAYGGMQPQFGPALRQQQEQDKAYAFDREKLNAQLDMARQKALEPPQFVQNLQAYLAMTPEQKRALLQQEDAMHPNTVATPQGTQIIPRTTTKQINGKNYYNIGGDWYEETE